MLRWILLPPVTAALVSAFLLAVPAVRAFVFEEEAWVQGGWALYFFFLPICFCFGVSAALAAFVVKLMGESNMAVATSVGTSGMLLVATVGISVLFSLFS